MFSEDSVGLVTGHLLAYGALSFVTKQTESKSKKTGKERRQESKQFGASEISKPHLMDVSRYKSLTYLVRILLETSYKQSQGSKD